MKKSFFIIILIVAFAIVIFLLNKNKVSQESEFTASPEASPTPTLPLIKPPSSTPKVLKTFDINITKDGVSAKTLTIKTGDTVKFINNDDKPHWPATGSHPSHSICPGFDSLRGLQKGEIYLFTFTVAKECPFHDHLNAGDPNLMGKIIVTE